MAYRTKRSLQILHQSIQIPFWMTNQMTPPAGSLWSQNLCPRKETVTTHQEPHWLRAKHLPNLSSVPKHIVPHPHPVTNRLQLPSLALKLFLRQVIHTAVVQAPVRLTLWHVISMNILFPCYLLLKSCFYEIIKTIFNNHIVVNVKLE